MTNNSLNKKTLREQVVDILREQMLRGELKPGERIVESEISERFQISRAPIREGLRQLEEEGLLTYEAHKGCVVRTISYREMQEAYLIRATLEMLAVRIYGAKLSESGYATMNQLASDIGKAAMERDLFQIQRTDEEFHASIVREASCERLYRMWKSLEGINAGTYYTMSNKELMPYNVLERNHRIILDSFETENVEHVCKMIQDHYMIVPEVLNQEEQKKMQ